MNVHDNIATINLDASNDEERARRGRLIAKVCGLKALPAYETGASRYQLQDGFGSKSPEGIYAVLERLVNHPWPAEASLPDA